MHALQRQYKSMQSTSSQLLVHAVIPIASNAKGHAVPMSLTFCQLLHSHHHRPFPCFVHARFSSLVAHNKCHPQLSHIASRRVTLVDADGGPILRATFQELAAQVP